MIAGDMAFHERLLPIFDHTDTAGWVETGPCSRLGATYVIPGHGHPTNYAQGAPLHPRLSGLPARQDR